MTKFVSILRNLSRGQHSASSSIPTRTRNKVVEQKVKVGEFNINYARAGHGPHTVLCLPGIMGTIQTDFLPILELMDPKKFTVISMEPPGMGKSRPPYRSQRINDETHDLYLEDATTAAAFMRILEFPKYSLMGYSVGGLTSAHIARNNPDCVEKLIFWSFKAVFGKDPPNPFGEYAFNWESLTDERSLHLLATYEKPEYKAGMFRIKNVVKHYVKKNFNAAAAMKDIKVPTLVIYGKQDPMIPTGDYHANLYKKSLPNCRAEVWPDAAHSLQLEPPERFVERAERFLLTGN